MTLFVTSARISESRVSHEMAAHTPFMSGTRRIHTKVLVDRLMMGVGIPGKEAKCMTSNWVAL
jgi:hypothetical protein